MTARTAASTDALIGLVVLAALVGCGAHPKDSAASVEASSGVTLLLQDDDTHGWHDANVTGTLDVNVHGCLVVDDALLIAPFGSTTRGSLEDGDLVVELLGYPPLTLGEIVTAGGATYHERSATALDEVPEVGRCVDSDVTTIAYAVIAPGQI
jgi:hypothetical protein